MVKVKGRALRVGSNEWKIEHVNGEQGRPRLLHLVGGGVKGGGLNSSFGAEDHTLVLCVRRGSGIRALFLGLFIGTAPEIRWFGGTRSNHGGLVTELETNSHHTEGDSKEGVRQVEGDGGGVLIG